MDLKKIQNAEVQNRSRIVFYRDGEGGDWYACNHSAWFVAMTFSPEKTASGLVENGMQTVYYRFSQEEVDALLSSCKGVLRVGETLTCDSAVPFKINAYYNWKAEMLAPFRSPASAQKRAERSGDAGSKALDKNELIRHRIAVFDLDNSTPRLCFNFIKELKKLIGDEAPL